MTFAQFRGWGYSDASDNNVLQVAKQRAAYVQQPPSMFSDWLGGREGSTFVQWVGKKGIFAATGMRNACQCSLLNCLIG